MAALSAWRARMPVDGERPCDEFAGLVRGDREGWVGLGVDADGQEDEGQGDEGGGRERHGCASKEGAAHTMADHIISMPSPNPNSTTRYELSGLAIPDRVISLRLPFTIGTSAESELTSM
jgi:hypothetical protein